MNQILTYDEIKKIQNMCFSNPTKSCAIAQIIIDTCQIISCKTFSEIKRKKKRATLYKADKLTGITIENRKFLSLNQ